MGFGATPQGMPKKRASVKDDGFKTLETLLDNVTPGTLTLGKTIWKSDGRTHYDVTVDTRESKLSIGADSLEEALRDAKDSLSDGTEDPFRPAWSRLSRHQRELVRRTLDEAAARHMARAAAAKLGAEGSAHAEYAMSDAFHAAVEELALWEDEHPDTETGRIEKLEASAPAATGVRASKPTTKR